MRRSSRSSAKGRQDVFGPVCSPELRAVGIDSRERIRELGWEEAYLRWAESFPARINLNMAVVMIGAEQNIDWLQVSPVDKERARRVVEGLRQRMSPGRRVTKSSSRSAP